AASWSSGPAESPAQSHAIRPGPRLLAASAGSALAALGMIAFLLGSTGGVPAPKVTPSVDNYLLQHAYDAGQAPASAAPSATPSSGYQHGAKVAGPALGRPEQYGLGSVAAFAARGQTGSGAGSTAPAASRSPAPMVSQHPG
ncbi:MAG TPA: hypothetical protein VF843_08415, partial [Streptosporangiaceae bacterium]